MADYPSYEWGIEQNILTEQELQDFFNRKTWREAPHAKHYQSLSPEPIEVIEKWGLDFHLGNVVKYIARSKYKGTERQDLEKALWYLQRKLNEI